MSKSRQGVSIVEFAIVVVAIALIIAIIMIGGTLTRSAQVQVILSDSDSYRKNFLSFKDKYEALPGDMANASTLWGAYASPDTDCPNSPYTPTPAKTTCDGDGNGRIIGYEILRAWQHLTNAEMLPGAYAGMSTSQAEFDIKIGNNAPGSTLSNGAYILYYQPSVDNTGLNVFPGEYGHVLMFGTAVAGSQTMGPILTPGETYMLDIKIDDGLPGTGNVTTSPTY